MDLKYITLLAIIVLMLSACSAADKRAASGNKIASSAGAKDVISDIQKDEVKPDLNAPLVNNNEDAKKVFASIFSKLTTAEYKVKYDMTAATNESAKHVIKGQVTVFFKGQKTKQESVIGNLSASSYFMDGKAYTCSSTPRQYCLEIKPSADKNDVAEESTVKGNFSAYELTYLPDRIVAGTNTKCFEYPTSKDQIHTYCYTLGGIPMYVKNQYKDGYSEMVALEFSTKVSDSEFNLPAEPQVLPSMPKVPGVSGYP